MKAESQKPKIVIWSRLQRHEPFRNIIYTVLEHLVEAGRAGGCQVILAGDTKLGDLDLGAIKGDYDLRGFYKTALASILRLTATFCCYCNFISSITSTASTTWWGLSVRRADLWMPSDFLEFRNCRSNSQARSVPAGSRS